MTVKVKKANLGIAASHSEFMQLSIENAAVFVQNFLDFHDFAEKFLYRRKLTLLLEVNRENFYRIFAKVSWDGEFWGCPQRKINGIIPP